MSLVPATRTLRPRESRAAGRCWTGTRFWAVAFVACCLLASGCQSLGYVSVRRAPKDPLAGTLQLVSYSGPKPSPRTEQLLRRYALTDVQGQRPEAALQQLLDYAQREPTPEKFYSCAELAYVMAKRADGKRNHEDAVDYYAIAVANAYDYLTSARFDEVRNPYDPEFRQACDIYNGALEGVLRIANKNGALVPGKVHTINTPKRKFEIDIVSHNSWPAEDIERLEFVNDYQVEGGLKNHYHTFGLGVPLIAVRKRYKPDHMAEERFYPPGLSFATTAFLRVSPRHSRENAGVSRCSLELIDPLWASDIDVQGRRIPLETDLTTPLAFFLQNPALAKRTDPTLGLFRPQAVSDIKGMYMIEPYDPNRIPVVMVHGLWSNPLTWMEMFNDLRAFPELRNRYQFWFYLYPTGQPFWNSAADLRDSLDQVRGLIDPEHQHRLCDEMVLVGHSMGGLVSRMQTIESTDAFWHLVSDRPLTEFDIDDKTRQQLKRTLYFHPNQSVKRVVTIATPHRGSDFANEYTRFLGRSLIRVPEMLADVNKTLLQKNKSAIRDSAFLDCNTSLDSLSPQSPVFGAMVGAPRAAWVKYHNIVGVLDESSWDLQREVGDGVVSKESAHADDAQSEIYVNSEHSSVHRHPRAVLEVRRILLDHWNEVSRNRLGPPGINAFPGPAQATPLPGPNGTLRPEELPPPFDDEPSPSDLNR